MCWVFLGGVCVVSVVVVVVVSLHITLFHLIVHYTRGKKNMDEFNCMQDTSACAQEKKSTFR